MDMNATRRKAARAALVAFGKVKGQTLKYEARDMVTDILADLQHFCQVKGIDFEDRLQSANEHYQAEKK